MVSDWYGQLYIGLYEFSMATSHIFTRQNSTCMRTLTAYASKRKLIAPFLWHQRGNMSQLIIYIYIYKRRFYESGVDKVSSWHLFGWPIRFICFILFFDTSKISLIHYFFVGFWYFLTYDACWHGMITLVFIFLIF